MSVTEWLLDSDPAIRWQVLRDLTGESEDTVARERSRVAEEGWGARLLDLQGADGHWGGAAFVPRAWVSTKDTLQLLRDIGVDPKSERVRIAIARVRERCTWGEEFNHSPFFEGETEACINGRVLAIGAYFGAASERLPNTTLVVVPGMAAETAVIAFDLDGVALSSGAACSSGKVQPSHVLAAMGFDEKLAKSALRISLGRETTQNHVESLLSVWKKLVPSLSKARSDTSQTAKAAIAASAA